MSVVEGAMEGVSAGRAKGTARPTPAMVKGPTSPS